MAGEPRYTEPMNIMVTTDVRAYLDVVGERERHRSMGESARHLVDLGIELDRLLQQRRAAGLPTNVLEMARLEAERALPPAPRRARPRPVEGNPFAEPAPKPCVADAGTGVAESEAGVRPLTGTPAPEGIDPSTLSRAQRRRLGLSD